MKIGNKVKHKTHDKLGIGEIIEIINDETVRVLWEYSSYTYNANVNPCMYLKKEIELIKEGYGESFEDLIRELNKLSDDDLDFDEDELDIEDLIIDGTY